MTNAPDRAPKTPPEPTGSKPVQLHISHSWGGGLERWIRDFCQADTERINLILKSIGVPGTPGRFLELYVAGNGKGDKALQRWELQPPISSTAIAHEGYCRVLAEIVERHNVRGILVSSTIGHSLDALATGLETAIICHDYYPFCPAINIYFDGICTRCEPGDLERCHQHNSFNRFLPGALPSAWPDVRHHFRESILSEGITLVVPSHSVRDHFIQLDPELARARFSCIPHGVDWPASGISSIDWNESDRASEQKLRLLVLGSLALHKGRDLLAAVAPLVADIAEIYLLGYGDEGAELAKSPHLHLVEECYRREQLADKVAQIRPDLGLLLSIWPETFSYTLSELQILGIPTLATRTGSFIERLSEGDSGFLVDPKVDAVVAKIRFLAGDRRSITNMTEQLHSFKHKTLTEMVSEYRQVLPLTEARPSYLPQQVRLLQRLCVEEKRLQAKHERLQTQLPEIAQLQAHIKAMESSKFWKLRTAWFGVKAIAAQLFKPGIKY